MDASTSGVALLENATQSFPVNLLMLNLTSTGYDSVLETPVAWAARLPANLMSAQSVKVEELSSGIRMEILTAPISSASAMSLRVMVS